MHFLYLTAKATPPSQFTDHVGCLHSEPRRRQLRACSNFRFVVCTLLSLYFLVWICGGTSRMYTTTGPRALWASGLNHLHVFVLSAEAPACPQAEPLPPTSHGPLLQTLDALFHSETYRLRAYESLGGAVRIPTETQDEELPPSEDPQHWSVFGRLHAYLEDRFPLIYLNLTVAKVNSYALVFHWQGSDISLKPILLTAHQDVVPVEPETASHWVHPPYSGFFDGKYIWGRGSCDDKSGLIASMTAIETLLDNGFKPERSIVLAFGIDEERGGVYGATAIRDYLLKKYGENAFSILVDEGGGYSDMFGTMFATPAIAEKGKLDVRIEVATPGGHSSIPPAHTSIGILSRLITELEANPHSSTLKREGTYYQQLQCLAEHGPSLPPALGETIKDSRKSDKALSRLGEMLDRIFPTYKPSTGTTQAVDIVRGGVKSNALPERAYAIINHRIADYSSVTEVQARFASIVSPLARSFNLSFKAFENESFLDDNQQPMSSGQLALTDAYGSGLNPAPITPTDRSGPWQLLSGTILFAFATNQRTEIKHGQVAVAPGLSLGNTDTRYYWNLTQHIFRYGHLGASDRCNGAHTINEAVKAEGYLEMIRFFTLFILNADKTDLLE